MTEGAQYRDQKPVDQPTLTSESASEHATNNQWEDVCRRLRRRQVGCRGPQRDQGSMVAIRRRGGSGECVGGAASAAAATSYLLQRRWWRVPS